MGLLPLSRFAPNKLAYIVEIDEPDGRSKAQRWEVRDKANTVAMQTQVADPESSPPSSLFNFPCTSSSSVSPYYYYSPNRRQLVRIKISSHVSTIILSRLDTYFGVSCCLRCALAIYP